jgi:hypothetical protein
LATRLRARGPPPGRSWSRSSACCSRHRVTAWTARYRAGEGGACRAVNMAHTTFPASPGVVQPHRSLNAQIICSPRPASASEPGVRGTGAAVPGRRPRTAPRAPAAAGRAGPAAGNPHRRTPGRACRSALVMSSDTTIAMSGLRSAMPHRCRVATVKSRAVRTDPGSAPRARVAIRGSQAPARQGGIRRWPPSAACQVGHLRGRHQPAAAGARLQVEPLRYHQRPVNVIAPAGPACARAAIIMSWPGSLSWPGAA